MRKFFIRNIFSFIALLVFGVIFARNTYALCTVKLVTGCNPLMPQSSYDCQPLISQVICCKDRDECLSKIGAAGAVGGPCTGLEGEKLRTTDPNYPNTLHAKCMDCVKDSKTYTALGCIPNDTTEFVAWLLGRVMGIGGGIAFLLIIYGGFQIVTSTGDPEKLNNGKDIIVSAMAGLLMIIFSMILLHIIGVDILHIPGFGT